MGKIYTDYKGNNTNIMNQKTKKPKALFIDDRYIRIDLIASVVPNHEIKIPNTDISRWGLAIRMKSGEEHVFIYDDIGKPIASAVADKIAEHWDVQARFEFPDLKPLPTPPAPEAEEENTESKA